MADFDKRKDPQKSKKYYSSGSNKNFSNYYKPSLVLAKPDRDRDSERERERLADPRTSTKPLEKVLQPTIILRPRENENRAVSPSILRKDSEIPQVYQLAIKPNSSDRSSSDSCSSVTYPVRMKSSIQLVDETFTFHDNCLEYLLDHSDFVVIGCLGLQGSGKSMIMSLLAGNKPHDPMEKYVFPLETDDNMSMGSHCTVGIDIYITDDRVILLDTQAILSGSIMDRLAQQDKKFTPAEFGPTENLLEVQSFQMASFLLSVCHIVIFVQDWFYDTNIPRMLQAAEMMKSTNFAASQDVEMMDNLAHVMFIHNRAKPSDFSCCNVELMQHTYRNILQKSRFQTSSGMGIATGSVMEFLTPARCGESVNFFLIPELKDAGECYTYVGHPEFEYLLRCLRSQLLGVTRHPLTPAILTEKNWFHYASKMWDSIKKNSFYVEFSKLLP